MSALRLGIIVALISEAVPLLKQLVKALKDLDKHSDSEEGRGLLGTLTSIDRRLKQMAVDLTVLKTSQDKVIAALKRQSTELRDLATKIGNTVDPAELQALADAANAAADEADAVVDEVDDDGSSPKQ